jgi:hypothetical protein
MIAGWIDGRKGLDPEAVSIDGATRSVLIRLVLIN